MEIPAELIPIREAALRAIQPIRPADKFSEAEDHFLPNAERTNAGEKLPPYYLVYFLLVDLLGFRNLGQAEKIAWSIPIDFQGRAFLVEHRKSGVGVFAHDAIMEEQQAEQIVRLIKKGVQEAGPFFDWLAECAVNKSELNVPNKSYFLYSRFAYFLLLYREMAEKADKDAVSKDRTLEAMINAHNHSSKLKRSARWLALAAIDAFYSWTEHVFIHLSILLGKVVTGKEVADLTEMGWPDKFKMALDLGEPGIKPLYDELVDIRRQLRNYVAHGAFGKSGESFSFHSGAGAVPILMPHNDKGRRYVLSDALAFNEADAIEVMEKFICVLWSGNREPAKLYIQESGLPLILTMAMDGSYKNAMHSVQEMEGFLEWLSYADDRAGNMDW